MRISFSEIAKFVTLNGGVMVGPAIKAHRRTSDFHFVFKPTLSKASYSGLNGSFTLKVINAFYPKVQSSSIKPYQVTLDVEEEGQSFRVQLFDGNLQYRVDKEFYIPSFGTLLQDVKKGFFFGTELEFSESSSCLFPKTKLIKI